MLNEYSKQKIIEHAKVEYPRECCGLLVNIRGKSTYVPCKNISSLDSQFTIDPSEYMKASLLGDILAVVHSHPNYPAELSISDRLGCEKGNIPWIIISYPEINFNIFNPSSTVLPLLGREFIHGTVDCYGLCRDYYKQVLDIDLPDFHREFEWWLNNQNLYIDNFESAGFTKVNTLKIHDIILMQSMSPVPNHAAVYLGNNIILNHAANRLSCRESYNGYWHKNTNCIIRHKELI